MYDIARLTIFWFHAVSEWAIVLLFKLYSIWFQWVISLQRSSVVIVSSAVSECFCSSSTCWNVSTVSFTEWSRKLFNGRDSRAACNLRATCIFCSMTPAFSAASPSLDGFQKDCNTKCNLPRHADHTDSGSPALSKSRGAIQIVQIGAFWWTIRDIWEIAARSTSCVCLQVFNKQLSESV